MEKDNELNNSQKKLSIRDFLGLSVAQISLDVVVAGLILTLINIRPIWHYFNDNVVATQQASLSTIMNNNDSWLDRFLHQLAASRIPQILFWILMGCVVYLVIWLIRNATTNIRNDVVASNFVQPNASDKGDYWRPILLRKTFFAAILAVLAGFAFASYKLVKVFADLCSWAVSDFHPFHSISEITVAILAVALVLQILLVLIRITARSWWSINSGL